MSDEFSVAEQKQRLREWARKVRSNLGAPYRTQADAITARNVVASKTFLQAPVIFTYHSMADEVDTLDIIDTALRLNKVVLLPRCVPEERLMNWHRIHSLDDVEPGYCGILEPVDDMATQVDPLKAPSTALALVPALTVDQYGFRIGYGGGYYDRFLTTFPGVSMALTRQAQRVENLVALMAVAPRDRRVQAVADETGVTLVQ